MNESLPIIDITPFVNYQEYTDDHRSKLSREVYDACTTFGFFYLTGHGIEERQLQLVRELARKFFQLDDIIKHSEYAIKQPSARGYQKLGENVTQYKRDWHEAVDYYASFDCIPEPYRSNEYVQQLFNSENKWPSDQHVPNFASVYTDYLDKVQRVGDTVMQVIASSLDLDPSYFKPYLDKSFWVFRIIGYPPLPNNNEEELGISCGEHTDYGCLTLLNQDETMGALQVLSGQSNQWIDANPIPGAFVVNLGDMLHRWTNGLYKSTLHRVVHKGNSYRISVPYFYEPNFNAVIKPVRDNNLQSDTVVYGEHLMKKIGSNFEWNQNNT